MKSRSMIFAQMLFFLLFGGLLTVSAQPGFPPGHPPPGDFIPGPASLKPPLTDIRSASFADVPAVITFDFADGLGKFSKYIFTVVDAPYPLEEGYRLSKDANFQAVGMIHFLGHPELSEEKARLLSKYGLEGVIYWENEASNYLPEIELKRRIDQLVNRINDLTQKYPNLKITTFLFGNEPDVPRTPFWKGTAEQFFQNYAIFARYLKAKNPNYVVGGPGFAAEIFDGGRPTNWPEMFLSYLHKYNVPIDFIAFHSYSSDVRVAFKSMVSYYKKLLQKYPVKSPIFGTPKLANNEYDLFGHFAEEAKYFKEFDNAWRAAHNILSLMVMVHEGIWLASELCGPFRITNPSDRDVDFLWVSKDGTIKPVYYAHKAFNALADTIQLAQQGSNFETFGALGGKSTDGNSVTIVLANYDEYRYQHFHPHRDGLPPRQSIDTKVYKQYEIKIRNLPWSSQDKIKVERFLVDDHHKLSLVESIVIPGSQQFSMVRSTETPEIQLLKIKKLNFSTK